MKQKKIHQRCSFGSLMLKALMCICLLSSAPYIYADLATDVAFAGDQSSKKTIRGVVIDASQELLVGATVLEKGTTNGTVANLDGQFQLSVNVGSTIIVSYIGMQSKEVKITAANDYKVELAPDTELLDEVVVTGYQTLSKERSTGSFAKVGASTLEMKRMNDLGSMLEGQVAGYVNGQIRGVTTMNAIANPMVVIDGFPVENTTMDKAGRTIENMPDLNPEDIESVTVLKDAAAASIYGARAANGVIVITTKKAKQGKAEINFSSTFTVQPYTYYTGNRTNAADVVGLQRYWATQNPDLMGGGAGALGVAADIRENGPWPSRGVDILLDMYTDQLSMQQGNKMLDELASTNFQYQDQVKKYAKRNPFSQQYNLRVGKTTDRNSFNFSVSYWDNKREDIHTSDKKLGVNITNSLQVTKWLQADVGVYLKYGEDDTQFYNPMNPGFSALPYDALVAPDGSYVTAVSQIDKDRRDLIKQNGLRDELITPMNELGYQLGKNKSLETRIYAKLKFDLTSWLNYNVMFQNETSNGNFERFKEKDSHDVIAQVNNFTRATNGRVAYHLPEGNMLYSNDNTKRSYNFRQQLNLNKTFDEKHNVVWILGQEVRSSKLEYYENTLFGYDPELLTWSAYNAKELEGFSGIFGYNSLRNSNVTSRKELVNRFVSFYTNASYSYDDRYVLSGSLRWDRSNLWGTSSKFQNKPLWSLGGSWNIDREAFFDVDEVSMLKLRASYGIGGNIGRNTAPYLIANYFPTQFGSGLQGMITSPPNKDIRWEKTATVNIGVDFALFNNRLSGTVDYYNKNSQDLLANISGSPTQGFGYSMLTTNNGQMVNRGFELTLSGDILRKKSFSWGATLLYAVNKNKVKQVYVKASNYDSRLDFPTSYPTLNNPLFGLYGYKWAGLNEKGDPQVYDAQGNITANDVRDADAIHYQGTTIPVHSGSFTNRLRYRDFELSAMIIFAAGHKVRDPFPSRINMADGRIVATNSDINNRWMQPGDEHHTDVPRLLFNSDTANYNTYRTNLYNYSDKFIYNASNIRINNISLAYHLPKQLCSKVSLSSVKLLFNVENVATIAFDHRAHYALNGKVAPNFVWGLNVNF